jgi:tetratricopeptide (TPR) repeat protein
MEGLDYLHASEKLETFLQRDEVPARLGEGWYRLGEAYRQLKNDDAAGTAYRECLKFGPPFANRGRYQLALASIQKGDLDEAEATLERNLKLLYFERDPVAREKSLFALGELLYLRKNYRKVVQRLEEALAPPAPTTMAATRARFMLADSYRMLAAQEKQTEWLGRDNLSAQARVHFEKEHQRWLKKAAEELQELAAILKKPESRGHLSREQEIEVPFLAARCRFNLGEYETALKMYEELAQEYHNQPQSLEAMGSMVSCYVGLNDVKHVRQMLAKIRKAVPTIEGMTAAQQKQWLEWTETASKGLPSDDDSASEGNEPSRPAGSAAEPRSPAILSQPDRNPPPPSVGTLSPAAGPSMDSEPITPTAAPSGPPSVVVPQRARQSEEEAP